MLFRSMRRLVLGENTSATSKFELMVAADLSSNFDVALVFSTKYEPTHPLLEHWAAWERLNTRFFGFHRDLPPAAASQVLGGKIVFSATRHGQWVAVIEVQRVEEARAHKY